jgi:NDP-mannose synthase
MRAVILAGGKGMRLRPYTTVLPKPLMPVGDRPILELILRQLARAGFEEVELCVGHLGQLIRAYVQESASINADLKVDFVWEDEPLGTAGALRQVRPPEDSLLVMNGDILTTIDYAEFLRGHAESGAALTIATHFTDVQLALGVIEAEEGTVTGYVEKPKLHYEVSMGIYACSARAFEFVPEGRFDFPDLVLALLAGGETVRHVHYDDSWFDIGTREEHERALEAFMEAPERYDSE